MSKLTNNQRNELYKEIERHPEASYYSIAKKHNVTPGYVSVLARTKLNKAKRRNIQKKWTGEIIDDYLKKKGSTLRRLTASFVNVKSQIRWGCSLCNHEWLATFDSIQGRFKYSQNLKGCPHCGYNDVTVYHDFLNELTHEGAYFMGVFFANGSVTKCKTMRSEKIKLTSNSKEKLEKILSILSSNSPIQEDTSYRQGTRENYCWFYVIIKSPQLIKKLKDYKIIRFDGHKYNSIPKIISGNKGFFSDFLRGYMDCKGYIEILGDKSLTTTGSRINIPGSKSFIREIQQFHKKALGLKKTYGYVTEGNSKIKRTPEFHICGNYATYDFLKLTYNSSVSPIKYMSTNNYNKFLQIQHNLRERAERNKKIRELADNYTEIHKELKKKGIAQLALKFKTPKSVIWAIEMGQKPKNIHSSVRKEIYKERSMAVKLKQKADKIAEEACTIGNIKLPTFKVLTYHGWKKIDKYSTRIEKVSLD